MNPEIVFGGMRLVRWERGSDPMPPVAEPDGPCLDAVTYEIGGDDAEVLNPGDGDLIFVVPFGGELFHEAFGRVELPPGRWRLMAPENEAGRGEFRYVVDG